MQRNRRVGMVMTEATALKAPMHKAAQGWPGSLRRAGSNDRRAHQSGWGHRIPHRSGRHHCLPDLAAAFKDQHFLSAVVAAGGFGHLLPLWLLWRPGLRRILQGCTTQGEG